MELGFSIQVWPATGPFHTERAESDHRRLRALGRIPFQLEKYIGSDFGVGVWFGRGCQPVVLEFGLTSQRGQIAANYPRVIGGRPRHGGFHEPKRLLLLPHATHKFPNYGTQQNNMCHCL